MILGRFLNLVVKENYYKSGKMLFKKIRILYTVIEVEEFPLIKQQVK